MNYFNRLFLCMLMLATGTLAIAQQNSITQTTTSSAALATDKIINVTSATGIVAPAPASGTIGSELFVVSPGNQAGEVMLVQSVNSNAVTVARGRQGIQTAIPAGATVLIGKPNWFNTFDPAGGCTASNTYVTPLINTKNGNQWLCSTVTNSWVPGFQNDISPATPTAAVASAAGLVTPSGPLFHITGTAAITGFNIPVGFVSGSFTVIPDGIFTTTTANNIALASTAVVGKPITFTYDPATAKFYPSY